MFALFLIVLLISSYCYAEMPAIVETDVQAAGRTLEGSTPKLNRMPNDTNSSRVAFESEAARSRDPKRYTSQEAADLAQQSQTYVLQQKAVKTLSKDEQQTLKQMKQAYKDLKVITSTDLQKKSVDDIASDFNLAKGSAFAEYTPVGGPYSYSIGSDIIALKNFIKNNVQDRNPLNARLASIDDGRTAFENSIALCKSLDLQQYFDEQGQLRTNVLVENPLSEETKGALVNNAYDLANKYDTLLAEYDESVLSIPLSNGDAKAALKAIDSMSIRLFPDGVLNPAGYIKSSAIDRCNQLAQDIKVYHDGREESNWTPATSRTDAVRQMNTLRDALTVSEQALKAVSKDKTADQMELQKTVAVLKTEIVLLDQAYAKNFKLAGWTRSPESLNALVADGRVDQLKAKNNFSTTDAKNVFKAKASIVYSLDLVRHALGEQLAAVNKLMSFNK